MAAESPQEENKNIKTITAVLVDPKSAVLILQNNPAKSNSFLSQIRNT
jgi:hypothetical protein